MENIISILLIICIISVFYTMLKLKQLLALGEVNSFNIMTAQDLSPESKDKKKKAIVGGSLFIISLITMLAITVIYGPIKG